MSDSSKKKYPLATPIFYIIPFRSEIIKMEAASNVVARPTLVFVIKYISNLNICSQYQRASGKLSSKFEGNYPI